MGFFEKIFGTHSQNELKRIYPIVDRIEAMDADMQKLTDEELRNKTREFKNCYYLNTKIRNLPEIIGNFVNL